MAAVQPKKPSFKLPMKPSSGISKAERFSKDSSGSKVEKKVKSHFKVKKADDDTAGTNRIKFNDGTADKKLKVNSLVKDYNLCNNSAVTENEECEGKSNITSEIKGDNSSKHSISKEKALKKEKKKVAGDEKNVKPEKKAKPFKSLTDEEYGAIFSAVLENVASVDGEDQDKNAPADSCTTMMITSGSDDSDTSDPVLSADDDSDVDKGDGVFCKMEESLADVPDDTGSGDDSNSDMHVAEERNPLIHDDSRVTEAQQWNEVTPVSSECDTGEPPAVPASPQKKKVIQTSSKKSKLEPKHLPFKGTEMTDKIRKKKGTKPSIKSRKKDNGNICTKEGRKSMHIQGIGSNGILKGNKTKKQSMLQREVAIEGTWVQCCNSTCMKWRYLPDTKDPAVIPERWTCNMNTRTDYNSCQKEEEKYDETEHIFTKFTEGSVVWAKMTGYPWWPAMVEIDPDEETYFLVETKDDMEPNYYHVVFFDDKVSRSWVKSNNVKQFCDNMDEAVITKIPKKGLSYSKEIKAAKNNALKAQKCSLKERIERFGFAARYQGTWSYPAAGTASDHAPSEYVKSNKRKLSTIEDLSDDESLDDSTIDEALDSAESLLENVAEMLDTLDSPLEDSDEDSDFSLDELIVVNRKRQKHHKGTNDGSKMKKQKTYSNVGSTESSHTATATDDNSSGVLPVIDKMDETGDAKFCKSQAGLGIKLDTEIFTMELSDNEDMKDMEPTQDVNKNEMAGRSLDGSMGKLSGQVIDSKNTDTNTKKTVEKTGVSEVVKKQKKKKTKDCLEDTTNANKNKTATNDIADSNVNTTGTGKNEMASSKPDSGKAVDYVEKANVKRKKMKTAANASESSKCTKKQMDKKVKETSAELIPKKACDDKASINKLHQDKKENVSRKSDKKSTANEVQECGKEKVSKKSDKKGFIAPGKAMGNVQGNKAQQQTETPGKSKLLKTKSSLKDTIKILSNNNDQTMPQKSVESKVEEIVQDTSKVADKSTLKDGDKTASKESSESSGGKSNLHAKETARQESPTEPSAVGINADGNPIEDNSDDDDFDLFKHDNAVPDIDENKSAGCVPPSSDRSVEENEFDLEEHSLYEESDEGVKIRERVDVHVVAPVVANTDEDSDPFDLMEE